MFIHEAVLMSLQNGKYIYRTSKKGIPHKILPTNTLDCCLIIPEKNSSLGKKWNPKAEDLMANDWEISN